MVRQWKVALNLLFVTSFVLEVHTQASYVDPSECRSLVDLYVVVDGSDSISYPDFRTLQEAIASLIPQIQLGPNKARFGMLVYSSHVPHESEHPFYDDAFQLVDAAMTLQHPRDGTNTALGLKHMRSIFKQHGRPDVPWVCLTITDGISKNDVATAKEAELAEQMGINMFAVGIGHRIDMSELRAIASTERQVITLDNFNQLGAMLPAMMTTICPCPTPPTVPLSKCADGPRAIGSIRQYQCQAGYLQRGNGAISCRDDSSWTPLSVDFQCVACSDLAPTVMHGTCGGGDFTIGARRQYVCDPGYLAVGATDIVCQDDAMWSPPKIQCIPCGDTPVVPHGSCGGGDFTIGTRRRFMCDPGYLAVGEADIVCQGDATWSPANFQCIPCGDTPMIKHGSCGGGDYTLGARRHFTCDPGYLAVGTPDISCQPDATWSIPNFQCIPCGDTPMIKHGSCGGGDYTLGARRHFTCDPGYLAVGTPDILCQPDATWSIPNFQCIPCGDTPMLKHGSCGGGEYTLGARRHFTCDPGYLAVGTPDISCQPDATWSIPNFQCIPCGDTPMIKHGSCGGGEYTLGARRHFTCDPGYLAVGEPDIFCQPDAMWNIPNFQCIPCGDTPVIKHGSCGGGDYTLGARRHFTCDPGYLAIGEPETFCQPDATWSMPNFQCIPCGDTPMIKHGTCGGGDYTLGARRHFTCDPGYLAVGEPDIFCQPDATWNMPNFQCIPCGDTPMINHGSCGGGDYTLGSMRHFTCEPGYLAVGDSGIFCQPDATWSKPNFQCIPCGDTPMIKHGLCGGGDVTLGSMRRFTCDPGYLAVGEPDILCQPDATWSIPNFQCIPCGETPFIEHGSCGGGDYTLGSMRRFTCDPGYLAIGNPDIVCQHDASWSAPKFQCVPCGNTPVIAHGSCGGGDYTLGSMRQFTCDPGYLAVGDPGIFCQPDATWNVPNFQCIPCGDTPVINNGACSGGDYTLGSRRHFNCDPGYLAVGNPDIVCQPDASWSIPNFQCIPCGDTPIINYGACGGGDFTLGSMRRFSCDPGYLAVGEPEILCQPDATWSIPNFQCIPCGDTPFIEHGSCAGGDFTLGSRRRFTCDPGYLAVGDPDIVCENDAMWSVPKFQCIPCGATPVINYGSCGGGDYTLGSMRRFTCDPGYLAVGQPEITCLGDAQWSIPQFECIPCGDTPVINHGTCGGVDYTLGARRMYSCEPGYLAVGSPEIVCQDNAVWSTPNFQCIPCGDTPVIGHGSCGGGDFTIGAMRQFTCEPGYYLKGMADIVCRDDATWSTPELMCIPCDIETPIVPHAECASGDHLIGSTRSYTCAKGYLAVGNPMIECLRDATWSHPSLVCRDCGAPPPVANSFTGLGSGLIGSTVEYHCDTGYKMRGRGQIQCLGNGEWQYPEFSCEFIVTTTSTTPAPKPLDPSVCDACRLINGVGYNNHPFDCSMYVQCFVGSRGMEPAYRRCPFGQFWDQNVLTCRPSHLVDCHNDKCAHPGVFGYKHSDPQSCCSYWKCENGRSYGECCGDGYSFDAVLGQCVYDETCTSTCSYKEEIQACSRRPVMEEAWYEQHIGGNHWVPMPCAPGTAYSAVDCGCSMFMMTVSPGGRPQACKPELYLPFNNGAIDRSGKNVYVQNENVEIVNGTAFFNGQSRLLINRFSNTEFVGDLVIKFRYKEILGGPTSDSLQALVTNGDCGSDPSIIIAKMPGFILLGAKTQEPRSFALPTLDKEWKEVVYMHDERHLEGRVCGATASKWAYGPIKATHCAVQIGYGNGLEPFFGLMDDLYIYQCRPSVSQLSFGY